MDVRNMNNHAILTDRELSTCPQSLKLVSFNSIAKTITSSIANSHQTSFKIILLDISTYYGERTWDNVIP
jgi:hypothetical protein